MIWSGLIVIARFKPQQLFQALSKMSTKLAFLELVCARFSILSFFSFILWSNIIMRILVYCMLITLTLVTKKNANVKSHYVIVYQETKRDTVAITSNCHDIVEFIAS